MNSAGIYKEQLRDLEVSSISLRSIGFSQSYPPFSPFGKAVLTGRFNKDTKFESTDFRSTIPRVCSHY